jgi:hypothetical protein
LIFSRRESGAGASRPENPLQGSVGSGIKATRAITVEEEISEGVRLLREGNGTAFVVLRVKPTDPRAFKRNRDPAACRNRFRAALGSG